VNFSPDDAELLRLLTRLLPAVSPDAPAPAPGPGRRSDSPDSSGLDGGGPGGGELGGGELDSSGLGGSGLDSGGPGGDGPNGSAADAVGEPVPVVSASEARALIELVAARGIAQGQLATLLGLEKSTVSRLAAGLERKGWVRRGRDEANQRYIRLYLTPEGSRIATRVWRSWQSRQTRILASLSAEERAGLAAGLRGLIRGLAAEGLLADARGGPEHTDGG
jgi:DNA-binding MarR family transcriptional regulator